MGLPIEVTLLFTIVGGMIAVATFFIGRLSSAKKDGQEWGAFTAELKTDIGYIKRDVGEIKVSVGENKADLLSIISKEGTDRRESVRRLHERMDQHLVQHHGMPQTKSTEE